MVSVPNAIIRHKGLLVDNTTKLEIFLPELTEQQDAELFQHAKLKDSAVIIIEPDMYDDIISLIRQAAQLRQIPQSLSEEDVLDLAEPEPVEGEWAKNEETEFKSR